MTFSELFEMTKSKFSKSSIGTLGETDLSYLFKILGTDGGEFSVQIKNGNVSIEKKTIKNYDVMFQLSNETYEQLLTGKTNAMHAYAMGKMKFRGPLSKALKLNEIIRLNS